MEWIQCCPVIQTKWCVGNLFRKKDEYFNAMSNVFFSLKIEISGKYNESVYLQGVL